MNISLKGYELLQNFIAAKIDNKEHKGISLNRPAMALTLEYALQAFCESDRSVPICANV